MSSQKNVQGPGANSASVFTWEVCGILPRPPKTTPLQSEPASALPRHINNFVNVLHLQEFSLRASTPVVAQHGARQQPCPRTGVESGRFFCTFCTVSVSAALQGLVQDGLLELDLHDRRDVSHHRRPPRHDAQHLKNRPGLAVALRP